MSDASNSSSSGIGAVGLLGVIFVVLKLIGEHFHTPVADWSWWWVTAPFWGGLALVAVIFAFVGGFAVVALIVEHVATKRRQKRYRLRTGTR